jgi:hypothetical protein
VSHFMSSAEVRQRRIAALTWASVFHFPQSPAEACASGFDRARTDRSLTASEISEEFSGYASGGHFLSPGAVAVDSCAVAVRPAPRGLNVKPNLEATEMRALLGA